MLRFLSFAFAFALVVVAGCAADTGNNPPPPTNTTLLSRLMANPMFDVVPANSSVMATLTLPRSEGDTTHPLNIEIESGSIQLSASDSGELRIAGMSLEGSDIVLDATALPPSGLQLTDLQANLENDPSGNIEWFGGGQEGHVDLVLDVELAWSLSLDGGDASPLEPRVLEGWMLHGQITVDASDNIIFTLEGTAPGPWMWGTLVELSDATMNLRAVQQVATNP